MLYGPGGTVWSWTRVNITVPGWEPPYVLAYVDLEQGPRILVHLPAESTPTVGQAVLVEYADEHDIYSGRLT